MGNELLEREPGGEIVLKPNKLITVLLLFFCFGCLIPIGVANYFLLKLWLTSGILHFGTLLFHILFGITFLLFTFGVIALALSLKPRVGLLTLTEEAVSVVNIRGQTDSIAWTQVEKFQKWSSNSGTSFSIGYRKPEDPFGHLRGFIGHAYYGIGSRDLETLLNRWREKFGQPNTSHKPDSPNEINSD